MSSCTEFDLVGVGFGPANLALAVAIEELAPGARVRFIEASANPVWQGAMLIDGSDIQNHPVRDLVTLRNPRSRYTFINYLFEDGRLIEHLNLPLHFPLRKDYARYVDWVTRQLAHMADFGEPVVAIEIDESAGEPAYRVTNAAGRCYVTRAVSLGTGRVPYVPPPFDVVSHPRVAHSAEYLTRLASLPSAPEKVAVIGGSQSAVEVTLDLAQRFPAADIVLMARGPTLALKDTSPFSEEGFFPGFIDHYHGASRATKDMLDNHFRRTNYSCIDGDVLDRLYVLCYEQSIEGRRRVSVRLNCDVDTVTGLRDTVRLHTTTHHPSTKDTSDFDLVMVATGYRDLGPGERQEPFPALLSQVIDRFAFDEDGYLTVNRDYTLAKTQPDTPTMVLNGLCETTHGIGDAGSFSLLSLRAETIFQGLSKAGVLSPT